MKLEYRKTCEIAAEYGFRPVYQTGPLGRDGWTNNSVDIWWASPFEDESQARTYFSSRR